MSQDIIQQLQNRIQRLEERLDGLEKKDVPLTTSGKKISLPELIKGRDFKNGQEKVAIIIGYQEKVMLKAAIKEVDVREMWVSAKFEGSYANVLLQRAIKEGLVRNPAKDVYDLSQSGEKFLEDFMRSKQND